MDYALYAAWSALTAVAAGLAAWAWRGRSLAHLRATLSVAQQDVAAATAHRQAAEMAAARDAEALAAARTQIVALSGEIESLKAAATAGERHHAEQVASLTALRQEVQDQFKLLSGEVVKTSSDDFLKRAGELFALQKQSTAAEIDKRAKTIDELVKPLGESLKAYQQMLMEFEKARLADKGQISATLQAIGVQTGEVKTVAAQLVNALRAAPKTRGRWGEESLRRVAELSGMTEHCDFDLEFPLLDEGLRPDMIVRVAGGRTIVVDAKTPLSAYLDAIAATEEAERQRLLTLHARQLRERMTNLSSKSYWAHFHGSADTVVMFVPGDNFVSAAFENDPDLFEDGMKNRVLICTPTTFIALMKAISYGWGQERLAASAREIGSLGKDLYARLSKMGNQVNHLGKTMKASIDAYNGMVASLENRVMPQARRFNDLGVEGTGESLEPLNEVDVAPRLPQSGRDLLIAPD